MVIQNDDGHKEVTCYNCVDEEGKDCVFLESGHEDYNSCTMANPNKPIMKPKAKLENRITTKDECSIH